MCRATVGSAATFGHAMTHHLERVSGGDAGRPMVEDYFPLSEAEGRGGEALCGTGVLFTDDFG